MILLSKFLVGAAMLIVMSPASALSQCPYGTSACASPWKVAAYLVLPTFVFFAAAVLAKRGIRRVGFRYAALAGVSLCWLAGIVIAVFVLAFTAACSYSCWY